MREDNKDRWSNFAEEMKREYENIPIPENLHSKVEASIRKAKIENRKARKLRWHKGIGTTVAAAAVLLVVLVNTNQNVAMAMEQIPVLGDLMKAITFRTYEDKKGYFEAKVDVPQIIIDESDGDSVTAVDKANQEIKKYTEEIIEQYNKDYEATGGAGKEDVTTTYEVIVNNDHLFTLRIDTSILMAGSNQFSKFYHIDKKNDRLLNLKDLFKENSDYINRISNNIKEQMRANTKRDSNLQYFIDTEYPNLNFKTIKPDQNFYINENGQLVIQFDKYEAAPGYMGVVEFEIPTDVISDILVSNEFIH
ncbi:MAG: RsiV family protein [Lachnospiraceae bacterium]